MADPQHGPNQPATGANQPASGVSQAANGPLDAATGPLEVGAGERLDRRTVPAGALATSGALAAAAVPTGIGLQIGDISWAWTLTWVIGGVLLLTAAVALIEWIRLRCSRFRIGEERIEYVVSLLATKRTSLPRDRIRTVDITANPAQRWLGIADIRLGTGDRQGDIALKSVDSVRAETLRRQLLQRAPGGSAPVGDSGPGRDSGPNRDSVRDGGSAARQIGELARFRLGWIRFAPISFWTPVLGAGAFGAILQAANWFNAENVVIRWFSDRFDGVPLLAEIGILAVAGLLVGAVANLAIFTEAWWQYTLEREPDGALRIRRGLLDRRSTTFQERRLRGLVLVRPLGLRVVGAARLDVLATGLQAKDDDSKTSEPDTLMPAAPLAVTARVATAVLGAPLFDPGPPLIAHPSAARRRRWLRAGAAVVLVTGGLLLLGGLLTSTLSWVAAGAVLPLAVFAAWSAADNYAGLGHRATSGHLLVRTGSVARRTVALSRPGLLGWNLRQSPLQRRAGLVTLIATTAAGDGAIRLPDAGTEQAVDLLVDTAPEWRHLLDRGDV